MRNDTEKAPVAVNLTPASLFSGPFLQLQDLFVIMITDIVENLWGVFDCFFISKSSTAGYKFYASISDLSERTEQKCFNLPPPPNSAKMI
jgi:hypothetical protein